MIISTEFPTGLPRSCKDWYDMGATQSCQYPIYSNSNVAKMVCNAIDCIMTLILLQVYCDMEGTNCDGKGGWTRLAFLDMTQPGATCPSGLRQQTFTALPHPLCKRPTSSWRSCASTKFTAIYSGMKYTEVCGRVRGYQLGSPEAFVSSNYYGIESTYVDGVSITHGRYPRKHIWSYAGGFQSHSTSRFACPCNKGYNGGSNPSSFIGNHYYCESGTPSGVDYVNGVLYANDVLWDGKGCDGIEGPCCTNPKLPWFYRKLSQQTADDIELRICNVRETAIDDVPIDIVEIFIR